MKYLFLLFCLPSFLYGQSLSKESSIRIYYYNGYWSEGITYMLYEKDTLIHNSKVSKYNLNSYWAGRQSGLYEYSKIMDIFLLDSAGSVSQIIPELSQYYGKFINYNLPIGDTMLITQI